MLSLDIAKYCYFPVPHLVGEYLIDQISIDYFKKRKPIKVFEQISFKETFVGELLYDRILQDYYRELKMADKYEKDSAAPSISGQSDSTVMVSDDLLLPENRSMNRVELLIMLSDSLDIERKKSKYGYYFCLSRYRYASDIRHVNVSYKYIKRLSQLREQISEALEERMEKEFNLEPLAHGVGIKEHLKYWYVFVPYINPDKSIDFGKTLNLSESEWYNLTDAFELLLAGHDDRYMYKRGRKTSLPIGKSPKLKRARRNSAPEAGEADKSTD